MPGAAQECGDPEGGPIGRPKKLTLLLEEYYGGDDIKELSIIKDAKGLKTFYAKINRTRKPGLAVPQLDFDTEMVLVHSGAPGQSVKDTGLEFGVETDTLLRLRALGHRPIRKPSTTLGLRPFKVYRTNRTDKPIVLHKP